MIRVLIVDDHAIVRTGLRLLLESAEDMEVVAAAGDGVEAIVLAESHPVDVALMDLSMPQMNGVEATRRLTARYPEIKVIVLTSFSDQHQILAALDAGATGYLLKDARPDEILAGIRAVFSGQAPLHPKAARVLLDAQKASQPAGRLSAREREVLALVGHGLANKQIARRLGITERTVKAHLTSVFQQLGVTDRTQAALWAHEHLLVD